MKFIRLQNVTLALSLLAVLAFVVSFTAPVALAQTNTTGALSGAVIDSSGAVVPGAKVLVVDTATGAKLTELTNGVGRYTVNLLKPSLYKVSASAPGLQSSTLEVQVVLGLTATGDLKMTLKGDVSVIEVSSSAMPLIDTENAALATNFTEAQIAELPMPGGDVSAVAFTSAGVVVNAGGSYGNFSSDGLPGISNLLVLNGYDNMDPFMNLGNSGSSNLTLGQGELSEATVIQNAYNSQFGRAAGAIINYTTKSGSNRFHGEADYNYNGTLLNANSWFNGINGLVRPHAVSNQWAANGGGPIIKNKLFFFSDFEGLRYVLPSSSGPVTFPSAELQTYILGQVPAVALPFYKQAFAGFQSAPAYATSIPVVSGTAPNQDKTGQLGCGTPGTGVYQGGLAGTPTGVGTHVFGVDTSCMTVGAASVTNMNKEWLFTQRVDWDIKDNHKIYGRFKMDRGSQPTSTSIINPLFSALSIQPEDEGQFNDTYIFSPSKTNVFVMTGSWYAAYFGPPNVTASYDALPMNLYSDLGLDSSGVNSFGGLPSMGVPYYLTQGRNVTVYQIIDDFSWNHGKHAIKFGENLRRALLSDYDQQVETIFPAAEVYALGDFAGGTLQSSSYWGANGYNMYGQAYTNESTAHLAIYNLGLYIQDDWQVQSNLKLTLGVRVDRTGNPSCEHGCFSAYVPPFQSSGSTLTSAYDFANGGPIQQTNSNAFPAVQKFVAQPRFGFNYGLGAKTEIRGGMGLFADLYPAAFLDSAVQNFPNYNVENVYSGILAPSGAGSTSANAATANTAIQSGFLAGMNVQQLSDAQTALNVPFSPPGIGAYFPGIFKEPQYLEFSFQIQRQISKNDAIVLTYAGNYGYNEIFVNPYENASSGTFCQSANIAQGGSCANSDDWEGSPFGGVGVTPPDQRFTRASIYTNAAHSNYNGGSASFKHSGHGLTGQLSYTYSHALDDVSNGGTGEYYNGGAETGQLTPSLAFQNLNYSNADYDIRHSLVGDAVYKEPFKASNKIVDVFTGGWVLGIKTYYRTGMPFSIVNGGVLGGYHNLAGTTGAGLAPLMPQMNSGVTRSTLINASSSNPHSCVYTDCMDTSSNIAAGNSGMQFVGSLTSTGASQSTFGNLPRNSLFGPHYADTDMDLMKKLVNEKGFTVEIGADAYNIFNHPNFANPVGDISSTSFGQIQGTLAPPTSPYGSFQNAAVTQRLLVLHGKITF